MPATKTGKTEPKRRKKAKTKRSLGQRSRAGLRRALERLRLALIRAGLRRPMNKVKRAVRRVVYWRRRVEDHYYSEVFRLAEEHAIAGGSVLDVGALEARMLTRLSKFRKRVALDRGKISPQEGVETIRANFFEWTPTERFDLVLCLQVLEHVPDAKTFAGRLFAAGRTVIISVPYRWPRGKCKGHVHDPVDEEKLRSWTGRDPTFQVVVKDKSERLIAVYEPLEATSPVEDTST